MKIQTMPAPPAMARLLAPALADPARRAVALQEVAPHPLRSTIPTGGILGAPPPGGADEATEAMRGFVLGQIGLSPTSLKFMPGVVTGAADDLALRHALSVFEKGLETELGPTVWNSVTLVIGAPQAIGTLMDGAAKAADRTIAAAKLLNGIAKVAETHWPQIAPYRHVLSLALTGVEAGKVAMLFLEETPRPMTSG